VNVDHLYLGSNLDNIADKVAKGRQRAAPGERHGMAKLTRNIVAKIRASKETQAVLARRFGVSPSCISLVRSGKRW
jgi:hypothetical protein